MTASRLSLGNVTPARALLRDFGKMSASPEGDTGGQDRCFVSLVKWHPSPTISSVTSEKQVGLMNFMATVCQI